MDGGKPSESPQPNKEIMKTEVKGIYDQWKDIRKLMQDAAINDNPSLKRMTIGGEYLRGIQLWASTGEEIHMNQNQTINDFKRGKVSLGINIEAAGKSDPTLPRLRTDNDEVAEINIEPEDVLRDRDDLRLNLFSRIDTGSGNIIKWTEFTIGKDGSSFRKKIEYDLDMDEEKIPTQYLSKMEESDTTTPTINDIELLGTVLHMVNTTVTKALNEEPDPLSIN